MSQNVRVISELAIGRLFAYLLIGAGVGYLGMQFEGLLFQIATGAAMIVLSGLLLLYALKKGWPRLSVCYRVSERKFKFPVVFGFLTGINICPPFLLAISYGFGLNSLVKGVLLFSGFFAGTSVYLVLLLPLGYLGRWENVRLIALMTAVLSGIFFFLMGIARFIAL